MEKKIDNRKMFLNLLLILLMTWAVGKFVFKDESLRDIYGIIRRVEPRYIAYGIFFSLLFIFGEALNIYELLGSLGYRPRLIRTIKYSFVGFFFSSITPSATGGQPMQIYEMKKDGIKIGHSSIILLIELMIYQLVTFIYGLLGLIYFRNSDFLQTSSFKYFVLVGLVLNLIGVSFFCLLIFNKGLLKSLVEFFLRQFNKLSFIGEEKKQQLEKKTKALMEEYSRSADFIRENKLVLFKVFFITLMQLGSSFSISYVVYRAFGQTGYNFLEILLIQGLIYIGSSFVPLPGSVGVTEKNSLAVFRLLYREGLIVTATILNRSISFYILILISILSLTAYRLYDMKKLIEVK